ncbi:MAG: two-component system OmpR family sensor kinase [Sulfurimonas sp.]|jgi:two-component system OmpR family sensor kinase
MLGYLYFSQQRTMILQKYALKMHEYIVTQKQTNYTYVQAGYSYKFIPTVKVRYELPSKEGKFYTKVFPRINNKNNILIMVKSEILDNEIAHAKSFVIYSQILLHIIFLLISFILAKISLKPMNETISHLDRFIKDLIHDLNTPATAIMLNAKMLNKDIGDEKVLKKIKRIDQSARSIASLYENLEILLDKNIRKTKINLFPILMQKIENYKLMYPDIKINIDNKDMLVFSNEKAMMRIMDNILSNACKYSSQNPEIDISFETNKLTIKDNGKGMKFPQKVFERSYTENENGHGIGMHIVHRLVLELDMSIEIISKEQEGTIISLLF